MSPRPAGNISLEQENDVSRSEESNTSKPRRSLSPRADSHASHKMDIASPPTTVSALSPWSVKNTSPKPASTDSPQRPVSTTSHYSRPRSAMPRRPATTANPQRPTNTVSPERPTSKASHQSPSNAASPQRPTTSTQRGTSRAFSQRPPSTGSQRPTSTASPQRPASTISHYVRPASTNSFHRPASSMSRESGRNVAPNRPTTAMARRLATIESIYNPPSSAPHRLVNTVSHHKPVSTISNEMEIADSPTSDNKLSPEPDRPTPNSALSSRVARAIFRRRDNAISPTADATISSQTELGTSHETERYLSPWAVRHPPHVAPGGASPRPIISISSGPASTVCPTPTKLCPKPDTSISHEVETDTASKAEDSMSPSPNIDTRAGILPVTILTISPGPASTTCPNATKYFCAPDTSTSSESESDGSSFPSASYFKTSGAIYPSFSFNIALEAKDNIFAGDTNFNTSHIFPEAASNISHPAHHQQPETKESKKGTLVGMSGLTVALVLLALVANSWFTMEDTPTGERFVFGLWTEVNSSHASCSATATEISRSCCALALYANIRTNLATGLLIAGMVCDFISLLLGVAFFWMNLGKIHWSYSLPTIVTLLLGADLILIACLVVTWDLQKVLRQASYVDTCTTLVPSFQTTIHINWGFYVAIASSCIYLLKASLFAMIVYIDKLSYQSRTCFTNDGRNQHLCKQT